MKHPLYKNFRIKTDDRFEKSNKLLFPRVKELKDIGDSCLNAGQVMRTKYDIQIADRVPKIK
jgi:hypothetical protein